MNSNTLPGKMTESELISRVIKKERSAQVQLFNQYQTTWYMICLRYHQSKEDAQDALQNALIKIFTKLEQFDLQKGSFKSWSSKVVVNENLMFLRKNGKSFKIDSIDEVYFIPDQNESAIDILSAEELTKMIQQLPAGYRAVFNLYVIEGYGHKEIADMLNIGVGTSKSQLSKARRLLQKQLESLLQE